MGSNTLGALINNSILISFIIEYYTILFSSAWNDWNDWNDWNGWNDYFVTKYIYLPSNFVKIKTNETKLVIIQFLFKLTSNSSGVNICTLKQLFLCASHCRIYGISEHYVKGKYFIWWLIRCSEKNWWRGYKGGKIEERKLLQSSWLEKLRQSASKYSPELEWKVSARERQRVLLITVEFHMMT